MEHVALLQQALDVVLEEPRPGQQVRLEAVGEDWPGGPWSWFLYLGTSGTGLQVQDDGPESWVHSSTSGATPLPDGLSVRALVVFLADMLQELIIEDAHYDSGLAPEWPGCPRHPQSHPPRAALRGESAWWFCPNDQVPLRPIGGAR